MSSSIRTSPTGRSWPANPARTPIRWKSPTTSSRSVSSAQVGAEGLTTRRLATAIAGVGLMLAQAPCRGLAAASNNASNLFPLDGPNQLETYARPDLPWRDRQLRLHRGRRYEDARRRDRFPARTCGRGKAPRCAPPTGWPTWRARDRLIRPGHERGRDRQDPTIYLAEGPPEKYQTTGRIDSTDWRTGQPRTNVNIILCAHIQVVYNGVNITSPSSCAQANFA